MRLLFTFLLLSLEAQSLSLSLSCQTRADKVTKHFAKHYPHALYPPETSPHFLSLSLLHTRTHALPYIHTCPTHSSRFSVNLCLSLAPFTRAGTRGEERERERTARFGFSQHELVKPKAPSFWGCFTFPTQKVFLFFHPNL